MLRKNFTSAPQQATSGQSPKARTHGGPELANSEHMADKERTHGRHMVDTHEANTRGGQGLEARPIWTHGGHKAGTWRTQGGGMADKWRATWLTQGGHMADAWRTRFEKTDTDRSMPALAPNSLFVDQSNFMVFEVWANKG